MLTESHFSCRYLWAFASIYTQIPGLYGSNGILPVTTYLSRAAPKLAQTDAAQTMTAEGIAVQFSKFPSVVALGKRQSPRCIMLIFTVLCAL